MWRLEDRINDRKNNRTGNRNVINNSIYIFVKVMIMAYGIASLEHNTLRRMKLNLTCDNYVADSGVLESSSYF